MRDDLTSYVLGHSTSELERLIEQGKFYGELSSDVLRRAGLAPGMSVLDVGCGAGDVSFLAASLVGPEGRVFGIDQSRDAIEVARARAASAGLDHIRFEVADVTAFETATRFDAVVGRLVLLYLVDPVAALRRLVSCVRPDGIVAFIELELSSVRAVPPLPLFATCVEWLRETFTRSGAEIDMGTRLHPTFRAAGLDSPSMLLLGRVEAGPSALVYEHLAATVRTLLPAMERLDVVSADTVEIESLATRLRDEAVANDAVIIPPCAIGAWTRVTTR